MDFMSDALFDGRPFRLLTFVDCAHARIPFINSLSQVNDGVLAPRPTARVSDGTFWLFMGVGLGILRCYYIFR